MIFEFQAWMHQEIFEAQKRVSNSNSFSFSGPQMANEAGHIANMTNQLKIVLFDLRVECLGQATGHGIDELRKCPHCGLVWAKIVGCDGATTCGEQVGSFDNRNGVMATFSFSWNSPNLSINKTG